MKRYLFLSLICFIPAFMSGQSGDGSSGNPFRGDISTTVTWSAGDFAGGTVYIGIAGNPDLRIISGGHLSINAGVTLIFTQLTSDLIITESGRLTVSGSASQPVVFTKGSQSHWGHISFEGMTTTNPQNFPSVLDHCIIERGRSYFGGGIRLGFTFVTLSNSTIRNNSGDIGGGILVDQNFSPTIFNCLIHSNTAGLAGGGIMVWAGSSARIYNCIIRNNNCTSTTLYGGGGVFAYPGSGSATIVNSTIVGNTSSFNGDNVHIHLTNNNLRFINCVVWNSNNSVYIDRAAVSDNFINSALQRVYNDIGEVSVSTYVNSFKLNSSNTGTNPAGPNFTNHTNNDFTFTFLSPLRDAGTPPSQPVPQDYAGNSRIGAYDLGAFEYQYSRWRTDAGSTDWSTSANWHGGVPTANRDIVLPPGASNYPTGTPAPNVTIGTGKYFIMEPGSRATINALANSGNMLLRASETEHSSIIANSHSGNNANIQIYLRSGTFTTETGQFNRWHFISSPFTSLAASAFTGTTINLAQWVESLADPSLVHGWVAYDGYNYGTGTITGPAFNSLTAGIGYNYYYTSPVTYTLSGQINTSNVSRNLFYTDPNYPTQYGLNLTGNPFPSGLDWEAITDDVSFPVNTSKVLHYTKDDEHVYFNNGIGSIPGMNGIIPPMQGFFVKTYNAATPTLTLSASARVHDAIPQRYKGKQSIPHLRLSLFSGEHYSDNTVVRFDNEAKAGFDYDFDAVKYFISDRKSTAYTFTEGKKYAINGQPFPDGTLELPLHVKVLKAGNLKIALSEIEDLDNYRVRLKDNLGNITIDLKTTPQYSFSSPAGTITDRFTILISALATGAELPLVTETLFRTWHAYGMINIIPDNEQWDGLSGAVTITDISGRRVFSQGNLVFHRGIPLQVAAPQASGVYIIEIASGLKRWTGRVMVRK